VIGVRASSLKINPQNTPITVVKDWGVGIVFASPKSLPTFCWLLQRLNGRFFFAESIFCFVSLGGRVNR
jgi:hypothetical protein